MNTVLVSLYLALCAAIVVLVPSMVMPYVEVYGVVTVFDSAQAVLLCTALASVAGIYAYKQGANGSFLLKLFLAAVLVRLVLATAIFVFRGQDFFGGDAITYDFYGFAQLNGWAGFPWQVISLRQSITLPEMIVWWASFPMLVLGLWFSIKYRLRMMSPILILP